MPLLPPPPPPLPLPPRSKRRFRHVCNRRAPFSTLFARLVPPHVLKMSKSKWSKERDAVLGSLFSRLISLETGIRSARNQKIAQDFCFSVTQNHTYLTCDEPSVRNHFRGIVAKLEVQGLDAKAECLCAALDELLLHPVAADTAGGGSSSKYGAVTAQVLAVLRGLEGDVSSLDWRGSVWRVQEEEDTLLLKQVSSHHSPTA
jgi:hypothetical protein